MHVKTPFLVLNVFLIFVMVVVAGCQGERAFRSVQLCMTGESDVAKLKSYITKVAREENMEFIDSSARTHGELERLKVAPPYRLIYFGLVGDDGLGLSVGNMGLSQFEVSIGFSKGSDARIAEEFADRVVREIKRTWAVSELPRDRGAFPMGCPGKQMK